MFAFIGLAAYWAHIFFHFFLLDNFVSKEKLIFPLTISRVRQKGQVSLQKNKIVVKGQSSYFQWAIDGFSSCKIFVKRREGLKKTKSREYFSYLVGNKLWKEREATSIIFFRFTELLVIYYGWKIDERNKGKKKSTKEEIRLVIVL